MQRFSYVTVIASAFFLLFPGCSGEKENTPQPPPPNLIKVGDLAPVKPPVPAKLIQTVELEFCILEMPQRNIQWLFSEVWPLLYDRPVRPNDPDVFAANLFQFGFGEQQMWHTIATLLESADTIVERRTKIKLDFGQFDELVVDRIDTKMNLFYLRSNLEIEPFHIDRGQFVFKVTASPEPGIRGICRLQATPVYMPFRLPDKPEAKEDISIESLGFAVNMSPGDFFILGPKPDFATVLQNETAETGATGEKSIAHFLFTDPQKSKIRLFAVFCTGISD